MRWRRHASLPLQHLRRCRWVKTPPREWQWIPCCDSSSSKADPIGELPQVHFASAMNPGSDHDFDRRVELASDTVSVALAPAPELSVPARVSPVSPREMRRNRILSTLVVADNSSESERSRLVQAHEVVGGTLDDDRLYDSVRRVGMGGDRLTLKF